MWGMCLDETSRVIGVRFLLAVNSMWSETDISPLLIHFREQLLFGIDVARGIGRVGAWIEGARVFSIGRDANDYFSRIHGPGLQLRWRDLWVHRIPLQRSGGARSLKIISSI